MCNFFIGNVISISNSFHYAFWKGGWVKSLGIIEVICRERCWDNGHIYIFIRALFVAKVVDRILDSCYSMLWLWPAIQSNSILPTIKKNPNLSLKHAMRTSQTKSFNSFFYSYNFNVTQIQNSVSSHQMAIQFILLT